jgi:hypothetical protein
MSTDGAAVLKMPKLEAVAAARIAGGAADTKPKFARTIRKRKKSGTPGLNLGSLTSFKCGN